MNFRFFRRVKIAPGVTLKLSKSGGSLSFGKRGAKLAFGPNKGNRSSTGFPGGMCYTTAFSASSNRSKSASKAPKPVIPPKGRLTREFFKRLLIADGEKDFIYGCRELAMGREDQALIHLENTIHLADGAFLAGFLALKKRKFEEAARYLKSAASMKSKLNRCFSKYGIAATMSFPIIDEVSAHVRPDIRGVLLALVEVYQGHGRWEAALDCLQKLRRLSRDDAVVKLSLVEVLLEAKPKNFTKTILKLAEGIENESPIHMALLLHKARALRELCHWEAAKDTVNEALRLRKGRPRKLLHALSYERARAYEALGQEDKARGEFQKLYAKTPDYKDVANRLGR
ncbi:MAG: DUF4236 domain-containing protein [Nitrospinota bacterium]|nr:DUF4236 domain-containing protein [Nitrospinota bacterium]